MAAAAAVAGLPVFCFNPSAADAAERAAAARPAAAAVVRTVAKSSAKGAAKPAANKTVKVTAKRTGTPRAREGEAPAEPRLGTPTAARREARPPQPARAAKATPSGAPLLLAAAAAPEEEEAAADAPKRPTRRRPTRRKPGAGAAAETPPAADQPADDAAAADTSPETAPAAAEEAATRPAPDEPLAPLEDLVPLGYAESPFAREGVGGRNRRVPQDDFLPLPDRFRIGLPGDYVQSTRGGLFDPYGQNVLKGDYPIVGEDLFLILTLTSDTLFEARRLPVPTSVSSQEPGEFDFFNDQGEQFLINQNFIATVELFQGDTVYRPRDFELRATVVGNLNYIHAQQKQVVGVDFREGRDRYDEEFAVQELFYEKHLLDTSANYDVLALRVGIQGFNSDFRGFLFNDNEPGVRLIGTYDNNKLQYNLAYFRQLEKDTNSGLNTFNDRDQNVFIANVYRQDFLFPGYTAQLSFHANLDDSADEEQYDTNGFLVRPAPLGEIRVGKEVEAYYLGWAGDGHIGRLNITHQFYQVFGEESTNPISLDDDENDINAQFFAVELSYDQDYIRYRASFAYQSGDDRPLDNHSEGFDTIFDNPNFAGGGISFFTRQAIRLTGSGVGLKQRQSLVNNLRTSKEQGQANFVNPGLLLYNVGMDYEATPKLKFIGNVSFLQFVDTEVMEELLQENKIDRDIGYDISLGMLYRPLLNNNIIINAGAACLIPGQGFKDLYTGETLYSFFLGTTFTY